MARSARWSRAQQVRAVELDLAGGRLDQAQQGARQRRLATARLADDAERLAAVHLEAHAVDRADRALAAARREMLGEPLHAQQHGHGTGFQQAAS